MTQVFIDGITDELYERLANQCRLKYPGRVDIKFRDVRSLGFGLGEIVDIANVGAFILALVGVMLKVFENRGRKVWNSDRIRKTVESELLKHDVLDFVLVSVSGFDTMLKGEGACRVVACDTASGDLFAFHIMKDGEAIGFRVSRHIDLVSSQSAPGSSSENYIHKDTQQGDSLDQE